MRRTDVVREVVQTQYTIQAMRGLRMCVRLQAMALCIRLTVADCRRAGFRLLR